MTFVRIAPAMKASPIFNPPTPIFIGTDGKAISHERLQSMTVLIKSAP